MQIRFCPFYADILKIQIIICQLVCRPYSLQTIKSVGLTADRPYILQTIKYTNHSFCIPYSLQIIQSTDRTVCSPYSLQSADTVIYPIDHTIGRLYCLQTLQSTEYIVCTLFGLSVASWGLLVWELASPLPQKNRSECKIMLLIGNKASYKEDFKLQEMWISLN